MAEETPLPSQPMSRRWFVAIPTALAVLSLCSSIFQSYNYARSIESAQRNVLRAESLRTCRDIIDVFFQFRLKAEENNKAGAGANAMAGAELKAMIYKFGAFGTFLANFQDESARKRYTELSWELLAIAEKANILSAEEFAKRFAAVDDRFGKLNEDCVKAAQARLI
jgi:hypothetical protein